MICTICGQVIRNVDDRHNAEPVASGVCCNWCNYTKVIPKRLEQHNHLIDTISL